MRPLQNSSYNLSFLNIFCTFIVWNRSYPLQVSVNVTKRYLVKSGKVIFPENRQFTIVFGQIFQKINDLLPYLNDFSHFLYFVGRRQAVFNVFRSSLASEMLFFAFSAFRLRATNDFQHFLTFPRAGKPIFADFLFSLVRESRFLPFFDFPSWGKVYFRWFLVFPRLGKAIFAAFQSSQPWESIFCRFSKLSSAHFTNFEGH